MQKTNDKPCPCWIKDVECGLCELDRWAGDTIYCKKEPCDLSIFSIDGIIEEIAKNIRYYLEESLLGKIKNSSKTKLNKDNLICKWEDNFGIHKTTCGKEVATLGNNPNFDYCPYCGNKIERRKEKEPC